MSIDVVNPHTGQVRETIETSDMDALPAWLDRSRKAQNSWAKTPFHQRCDALRAIADACDAEADVIALHIHEEMGKPLRQAVGEIKGYTSTIEGSISSMERALQIDEEKFEGATTQVHYLPIGVVAVITPWNFPFGMPWTLLIPSLLGGNSVIFKPTEIAPRTGIEMAKIFNRFLPPDVLQIVLGAGAEGSALSNADVDLIAFVGSRDTGKKIMQAASRRATRVLLEMGGKDPMIVAKDADLDKAAQYAAQASNRNTGQVCVSVERIYVEKEVAEEFTQNVLRHLKRISVGTETVSDELLNMGPLASERQLDHVENQLRAAREAGATIHGEGRRLARDGFWMRPTLVTGVNSDMAIMRDETFGPVTCIEAVDSLEEAIARANDTRFGLAATLWTGNRERARDVALQLESGMVGINRSFGGSSIGLWAGTKESGYGHTGGVSGMRSFLQPRTITQAE